jgi:DNA-binding transcriptional regulator LsrR (DeoR family)
VDGDVSRAELLAQAVADGLTQQEMAEGLGLSQPHITRLLRYHRFNIHACIQEKIPATRFMKYWQQVRDPRAVVGRRKPEEKDAYEKTVFQAIAEMIEAGKPPLKPVTGATR